MVRHGHLDVDLAALLHPLDVYLQDQLEVDPVAPLHPPHSQFQDRCHYFGALNWCFCLIDPTVYHQRKKGQVGFGTNFTSCPR